MHFLMEGEAGFDEVVVVALDEKTKKELQIKLGLLFPDAGHKIDVLDLPELSILNYN